MNMENRKNRKETLMSQEKTVCCAGSDDTRLEEFRSLLGILDKKTEILYRECRFDQEKTRHIRTMGSILADMTVLVNQPHKNLKDTPVAEIFTDARGCTYQTVRSCDLDRIRDK